MSLGTTFMAGKVAFRFAFWVVSADRRLFFLRFSWIASILCTYFTKIALCGIRISTFADLAKFASWVSFTSIGASHLQTDQVWSLFGMDATYSSTSICSGRGSMWSIIKPYACHVSQKARYFDESLSIFRVKSHVKHLISMQTFRFKRLISTRTIRSYASRLT